jgi:hypothetical protein
MAFAVTKFQAYGLNVSDTGRKRAVQRAAMTVTAAATDTTWDIGTLTGTFWTSAVAHATYGSIATQALAMLTNIGANASVFASLQGTITNNFNKVASVSAATDYTMSISNGLPVIGFTASDAPTSAIIIMEWSLNDSIPEYVADIGA